eukprot:COSAG03_NODE_4154_length_1660_cov_6.636771_1_plen_153_part_00
MAAAGAARPFACDVPDCLCRYRVYLQTKKRRGWWGPPQKIVGEVYGATHPVSQRIEVWVMQADSDDAVLPTGSKSICFRCSCQAHKEIMRAQVEGGGAASQLPTEIPRIRYIQATIPDISRYPGGGAESISSAAVLNTTTNNLLLRLCAVLP